MNRRQEKVSSVILHELSMIINRKVQDPRVRGVHIVDVEVSHDFSFAKIRYSFLDEGQKPEDVQKGLDSAKTLMRKELRKVLTTRVVPEIAFFYDSSIKHGDHILELLRTLEPSNQSMADAEASSKKDNTDESNLA
ncbi:MAG: 30S ribosome-binding factor RbfA [Candidatus Riflebacteria bacterium]|nr:30S ribosome-binding factor RbfA [Candidatus Riflebacteria bacterium]